MGGVRDEGHDRISVALIDDHPAILAGVEHWYATASRPIDVVASGDGPAAAWTPPGDTADVVVFDLQLGEQGPAFADLRRLVDGGRQVVVYTMRDDDRTVLTCLDIGVSTFVTKAEGKQHLVAATIAAAEHRPCTPPALAGAIGANARASRPHLSSREQDVLVEWFQCESKELVARKMGLSARTVNTYLDRVRIKYANAGRRAGTKAALVARAVQDGLIGVDEL